MAKSLYLILVFIWLTPAIALLTFYLKAPEAPGAWEYRAFPGLIALGMAVYNLVRWWSQRARHKRPGVDWDAVRHGPRRDEEPADSRFQLADEPPPIRKPPAAPTQITEEPPPPGRRA
jgi:hypothetical protein